MSEKIEEDLKKENEEFINLRIFTHYSVIDKNESILQIDELFKYKKASAIGICDRMNLFGVVDFCKKAVKNKIKPVIGCLLKIEILGYLPFYIQNEDGFLFISKILTDFYIEKKTDILIKDIIDNKGVIVLSGGEDSIFYSDVTDKEKIYWLKFLKETFKDKFYIEIQNLPHVDFLLNQAKELNIPIVITHPVCFLNPEDFKAFYVMRLNSEGKKYSEEEFNSSNFQNRYFQNTENIKKIYPNLIEGIINSKKIAIRCSYNIESKPSLLPKLDIEDEYGYIKEITNKNLDNILKNIPEEKHEIYRNRLNYEINILRDKNLISYILITQKFIELAKNLNITVGPGRGSAAGSLTCYCLKITTVDPIYYGLIFERFINAGRCSLPDIDLDFSHIGREKLMLEIQKIYGYNKVVNIITFGTLQSKSVLKEVARSLGFSFSEINELTSLIPFDQVNKLSLSEAIELVEDLKKKSKEKKYEELFKIGLKLEGVIKNTSVHAAGKIISDKMIYEYCPIYRNVDGELSTHYGMKDVEYIGLVKFDFLGVKTLTILENTFKLIKEHYNIDLNYEKIPTNDEKTFELIRDLNLLGVFQFEGNGMQQLIKKLKPTNIEHLISANALFRPGAINSIDDYIKRKNGEMEIIYPDNRLIKILEPTYGTIVYQEQVMKIAVELAGYTDTEADNLRRAMGKKLIKEMENERLKFMNGALKNNVKEEVAIKLFDNMVEFSGYGFNKSHSCPYALIGYYCAYLKANYPLEFMSSLMTTEQENQEQIGGYYYNLKNMKINIFPPCVNNSANYFKIENNSVYFSLRAIKGIGDSFAETIYKEREKNGRFLSLENFIIRLKRKINKSQMEGLIFSGALDTFGLSREIMIENLPDLLSGIVLRDLSINNYEKWSSLYRYNKEHEILGFYFHHPIRNYQKILNIFNIKGISEIKKSGLYCGSLLSILRKRSKKKIENKNINITFAFIKVSDDFKIEHFVIQEQLLKENLEEKVLLIFNIENNKRFTIKNIFILEDFLNNETKSITLTVNNTKDMEIILDLIQNRSGNIDVYLEIEEKKNLTKYKTHLSLDFLDKLEHNNINYKIDKK